MPSLAGHLRRTIAVAASLALTSLASLSSLALSAAAAHAAAISDGVVKIGVLTDLSGVSSDNAGKGSVLAATMAIDDFSRDHKVLGAPIELISADSQGKTDTGATIAREWYDRGKVDMITDLTFSNVALAVDRIADEKKKIALVTGAGSSAISNEQCTAHSVQWMYDTYALANSTSQALLRRGLKSWYFITADYAFGQALEKDASEILTRQGGKVVGSVKHPVNSPDLSSYLLRAQTSGAQVIALANSGTDTLNTVKQASQFNIIQSGKQVFTPLLSLITEVHGMGLKNAQGMILTNGFYWDQDDRSRAFAQRFYAQHKKMPTMMQAAVYSAVLNYLKAIQAAGTDEADAVMTKLKSMKIDDPVIRNGQIRADGKLVHDMLLVQVKTPAESKSEWDLYKILETIPADKAFAPLAESKCALVKK
ncbi:MULTISPECIES: ABC transporter substrate-binding protein [Pandoraea]|uniref:ABC transporter permease n=1 Tax=Pandoraea capi TaxID=2508286 RepID=A0ABY6W1K5_9BURK|nr:MULTISPECIES: ABC transporter substrate-binding protein [Pandoraea]MCI3206010.1 ABC transporter permease [Pandoraea sp. LA3]MDN4584038.1 ABC transporter permease [Pandoraea capi]VVE15369.1 ABC transporter permease [Pandoraea capi]